MEKLAVFKIEGEKLIFCSTFSTKEEAIKYLEYVRSLIDDKLQSQLKGEYIIMPTIHFNLK